ncbi:helix-turn-helix domain-containing protein [Actinomadura montaniterrae]|uniref:Helix-turn-helix domain-containing protein n=1 Tax=Actinomadura montaniterrae TaxID=1803903 RepID=A0A6L3VYW5_9ACTN|nr:helix-turn-helix domain-containing protein [Actinomadura montaniterrae]KAB2386424.1 helix-turn-helix domain-containing protein [Actinomadura montaniterrae]
MAAKTPSPAEGWPLKPLYKISDLPGILPFSRSRIYELVRAGRIRTVKEHSVRLVPASAIVEYIELLEKEANAA